MECLEYCFDSTSEGRLAGRRRVGGLVAGGADCGTRGWGRSGGGWWVSGQGIYWLGERIIITVGEPRTHPQPPRQFFSIQQPGPIPCSLACGGSFITKCSNSSYHLHKPPLLRRLPFLFALALSLFGLVPYSSSLLRACLSPIIDSSYFIYRIYSCYSCYY